MTVGFVEIPFPLTGFEGTYFEVCIFVIDDAPGGRECPIEVTLVDTSFGVKPGE